MSESGLYTLFRENFKTTPIGLKNQTKVEKAVKQLELTSMSVEEISDSLGFPNTAYFRKIVKRYTGKTPSVIRKEFKHI
jgi:AraC family transcriptional regulator of arabinose operon